MAQHNPPCNTHGPSVPAHIGFHGTPCTVHPAYPSCIPNTNRSTCMMEQKAVAWCHCCSMAASRALARCSLRGKDMQTPPAWHTYTKYWLLSDLNQCMLEPLLHKTHLRRVSLPLSKGKCDITSMLQADRCRKSRISPEQFHTCCYLAIV